VGRGAYSTWVLRWKQREGESAAEGRGEVRATACAAGERGKIALTEALEDSVVVLGEEPSSVMAIRTIIEPFRIKSVEPIRGTSRKSGKN